MNREDFLEVMDLFCDLNDNLEICRGYTQANEPDLKVLDTVLFNLQKKYREIYERLYSAGRQEVSHE